MNHRWGMTVPFAGVPLADHGPLYAALHDAGFTDLWTSEVAGSDGFTPLAIGAITTPRMRLGTAVAPVFTRGPGLLAMTAGALAETAPGRFVLGIGASSPVVVGDWNAVPFTEPFKRSRDMLRFLRPALAGEMVDGAFDTFEVRRFRLERPPAIPPKILLAALRPAMLRLAAAEADGTILNWLSAADVATVRDALGKTADDFEIAARIFICPTDDADHARSVGRRLITSYLTVPAYAEFHRWLGNAPLLEPVWSAWEKGDRRAALAAVPDELVDALVVHGTPHQCREQIMRYVEAGVTTPIIAPTPTPELASRGAEALGELIAGLAAPSSVERG